MAERLIYSTDDVLGMLDELLQDRQGQWRDGFFSDRKKPCPFFVEWPDESLVSQFASGELRPGRVLELGCGHGRNALYLASQGCEVDAVDFSEKAIGWAEERAAGSGLKVNFICNSIFDLDINPSAYDIVYDCGCFHHLPPHRRETYVDLVTKALKPGGRFGLVCFTPKAGSGLTDMEVYEQRKLGGGLGYTESQLREIFSRTFEILSLRKMKETPPDSKLFGKGFFWTLLLKPHSRQARNGAKESIDRTTTG
jgi:SAM-dependent methyltransferase